jgi:hypothetical protein
VCFLVASGKVAVNVLSKLSGISVKGLGGWGWELQPFTRNRCWYVTGLQALIYYLAQCDEEKS